MSREKRFSRRWWRVNVKIVYPYCWVGVWDFGKFGMKEGFRGGFRGMGAWLGTVEE